MKSAEAIAEKIEEHVRINSILEMICEYCEVNRKASPLINFRDALSHYVLYCDADTDTCKIAEEASIEEHIFRGTKDMCVHILYKMKQRVSTALCIAILPKQQQDFRILLHGYKELELNIRGNTESASSRSGGFTSFIDELANLAKKTKMLFEEHGIEF